MKEKSFKRNIILNAVRTIFATIFPLITFPYASRILQVNNLGKVNFSNSIVSYFSLIAALGIATYAIREGARFRDNKVEFNKFASEIFSINIIATFIAYIALVITIIIFPKLHKYTLLLIIQSSSIIFTTIGVDWVYSIYEDYFYITLRSLVFQVISLILLFLMVKSTNDYYLYAFVSVLSSVGSNLMNFIHSRKYCKISLTININVKRHIKPIMVIFATSIASVIYVNSDMTILGILGSNYNVGLYSCSAKIYSAIKNVLAAILVVSIPRLSYYIGLKKFEDFENTLSEIFNSLVLFMVPTIVGIFLLSKEIIFIFSGEKYLPGYTSLKILSIALLFCLFAWFFGQCILLTLKKEMYILKATIVSAIVNIGLNLVLIPLFKEDGAAITTVIAEAIAFIICAYYSRKLIRLRGVLKNLIESIIGCVMIVLIWVILKNSINNLLLYVVAMVICSVFGYFLTLLFLKNYLIVTYFNALKKKLKEHMG